MRHCPLPGDPCLITVKMDTLNKKAISNSAKKNCECQQSPNSPNKQKNETISIGKKKLYDGWASAFQICCSDSVQSYSVTAIQNQGDQERGGFCKMQMPQNIYTVPIYKETSQKY